MRKLKHLFMLCLFGMISIGAMPYTNTEYDFKVNGIYYKIDTSSEKTVSVTCQQSVNVGDERSDIPDGYAYHGIGSGDDFAWKYFISDYSGNVTIPSTVYNNGTTYNVTGIESYAFSNCFSITSITIPSSVTNIGSYLFENCSGKLTLNCNIDNKSSLILSGANFSEIIIGEGVDHINYLFNSSNIMSNLKSITIPSTLLKSEGNFSGYYFPSLTKVNISNLANWFKIAFKSYAANPLCSGADLYYNGTLLTSIALPSSITKINDYALYGCKRISSITIPNTIESIGKYAFSGCSAIQSMDLPASVIELQDYAFQNCSSLATINMPSSLIILGEGIFDGCNNLQYPIYTASTFIKMPVSYSGSYTIPSEISSIAAEAFKDCSELVEVAMPNTVITIGEGAFRGCSGLTSVTIPNSVISIGNYAFWGCSGLTCVTIPNSVTSIGDYAFYECSSLTIVHVEWKDADKIPGISSYMFPYSTCDLYVPAGTETIYRGKDYWNTFKNIIGFEPNIIITNTDETDGSIFAKEGDNVALNDNIKSISIAEGINNINVTYTRNFENAGVWQAWYMPFDVDFDDMKDAYDVAQIHGVLLDKDNNAVLAFLKLDKGTVNANTPYVVRPKKSGEVAITTTTDLLPTQSNSFLIMSATDKYTIGGVYEKTTTPGNWYALNLDGQFQLMGSGVYLRPFRIYMTIDPRTDNPYAQSAATTAKMDIVVIGDDETTGITSYENPSTGSGQAQNDNIYNLNGQRVTSIKSGQIYIMNGKKYIAK